MIRTASSTWLLKGRKCRLGMGDEQDDVTVNMVSLMQSIKNTVEKLDQDIRECKRDIKECKKDIKDVKERHENRENNDNSRLSVRGNSRF